MEVPSQSLFELLHVINPDQFMPNKGMSSEAKQAVRKGLALAEARGEVMLTQAQEAASAHGTPYTARW